MLNRRQIYDKAGYTCLELCPIPDESAKVQAVSGSVGTTQIHKSRFSIHFSQRSQVEKCWLNMDCNQLDWV